MVGQGDGLRIAPARRLNQLQSTWMGPHPGILHPTRFLRTAKRLSASMEACGALRKHLVRPFRRSFPDRGNAERPIAPGNDACPPPPWDTAFPGAFFMRSP
jgi:hypothetical protein